MTVNFARRGPNAVLTGDRQQARSAPKKTVRLSAEIPLATARQPEWQGR